jgi:hypothetical protein
VSHGQRNYFKREFLRLNSYAQEYFHHDVPPPKSGSCLGNSGAFSVIEITFFRWGIQFTVYLENFAT